MLKVNFSAPMLGDGRVGLGCIRRDDEGRVVWMAARQLRVSWDVFSAESAASRLGVSISSRLGFSQVVIEGALHSKRQFKNVLFHFF